MVPDPKFIFFGTPKFSATILEKLIEADYVPSIVITNPDKPTGRTQILTPSPVKVIAQKYNIPILQPQKLRDSLFIIHNSSPTFGILAAYGKIIPQEIIDAFPKGIAVVHPSLLPRHRGATPIQTTILEGDEKTGTTLILMDKEVDHGPILAQKELNESIERATTEELLEKLSILSADLLIEILPKFQKKEITPREQNHPEATFTKKFAPEDAFVNLEKDEPTIINRKIRALNPEPGAWTILEKPLQNTNQLPVKKRIKLLESKLENNSLTLTKIHTEGKPPQQTNIKIKNEPSP